MKNIIVIPVYKPLPDETDIMSLRQCVDVLGKHKMCLVCPQELDVTVYTEQMNHAVRIERFEEKYFQNIQGYSDLMKGRFFYERFKSYRYMLIYQLDAWVFEDQFDYWCRKGYDYIGAPWFQDWGDHESGYELFRVGNGGFSLRKVSKFLKITDSSQKLYSLWQLLKTHRKELGGIYKCWREYCSISNKLGVFMMQKNNRPEDLFFCCDLMGTNLELSTPDCQEASLFSIEVSPQYVFNEINKGKLPFGCHAWRRYQYEFFWSKFIPSS